MAAVECGGMKYTLTTYDSPAYLCARGYVPGHVEYRRAYHSIAQVSAAVCSHYRLKKHDMKSACRGRNIARPRQIAMYLSRKLTLQSLPQIGRYFGGRDHTTVIWAIRQIKRLRETDADLDADVRALILELRG